MKNPHYDNEPMRRELRYRVDFRRDTGLAPYGKGGIFNRRIMDLGSVIDAGAQRVRKAMFDAYVEKLTSVNLEPMPLCP